MNDNYENHIRPPDPFEARGAKPQPRATSPRPPNRAERLAAKAQMKRAKRGKTDSRVLA